MGSQVRLWHGRGLILLKAAIDLARLLSSLPLVWSLTATLTGHLSPVGLVLMAMKALIIAVTQNHASHLIFEIAGVRLRQIRGILDMHGRVDRDIDPRLRYSKARKGLIVGHCVRRS